MTVPRLIARASTDTRHFFVHIGALGDAAIALAVVAIVTLAVLHLGSRRGVRIAQIVAPYRVEQLGIGAPPPSPPTVVTVPLLRNTSLSLGRRVARTWLGKRLETLLQRSDAPLDVGELVLVWLVGGIVLVLGAYLLGHAVAAAVALVLVAAGPPIGLRHAVSRRQRRFAEQLPDLLKLTASALRAGFSFAQSLDGVVRQIKKPAQRELQQVLSEMRLGKILEDALWDAAQRIENRDFTEAVIAVRIQQETGGNLAALLDVLANTMTQRVRIRREIRTLTAEGRSSAFVLGLLPLAIGLFIYSTNRAYIAELFHTTPGLIALIGGAVLEVVGFLWMFRIVKIEV